MTIITDSPEETRAAGERVAALLRPGDVLAFTGGMGAGKTTFISGLCRGLGIPAWVSSPTFALVHEYTGRGVSLCHFDMYRVTSPEDLYATGFFDYLDGERILAVEWSENVPEAIPAGAIHVEIRAEGETRRIFTLKGDERFEAAGL